MTDKREHSRSFSKSMKASSRKEIRTAKQLNDSKGRNVPELYMLLGCANLLE